MFAASGSFNIYFNFFGSSFEFFPNNYCRIYGSFWSLNSCFTDYLFTPPCLSIIWFNNSALWFFYTPKVDFIKFGSIPFFLPIYSNFFNALSSMGFSSTFLQFDNKSNGFFLFFPFLFSTLSMAAKSGNYKSTLYL